jgi:hypothetical protein
MAPSSPVPVPVLALTSALPYREHAAPMAATATIRRSVLFLRQVDDFAMAFDDPAMYEKSCDLIDTRLNEPIKRLGLLELYNGTNIEQTRDYMRLHCTSYIDKILAANTWIGDSARARVDYMRLHCTSYIDKILAANTWIGDSTRARVDRPVRMNGTPDALRHLDTSPVPSSDS